MIEIIVSIHGGVVQDVFCSDAEATLIIVDWDTEGASPEQAGVDKVKTAAGQERLAHVERSKPARLSRLAGTDVESALQAAKQEFDAEPIKWRYLLYDFDADELATPQLFGDYAEACEVAGELNNVLVLEVAAPAPESVDDEDEFEAEEG
jgi:hypothetical protein